MKNVRYEGKADVATLEFGTKTYRWEGHGDAVELNNDHAEEAIKDPRFVLGDSQDEDEEAPPPPADTDGTDAPAPPDGEGEGDGDGEAPPE